MAIEKMKLFSITGNEKELDHFIAKNLLDRDIQIEDAKKVYHKGWKFEYYSYDYTIQDKMKKCRDLIQKLNIVYREEYSNLYIENSVEQIGDKVEAIKNAYEEYQTNIENCQKDKENNIQKIESAEKLRNIDIDIKEIASLKYMKFRYGNLPTDKLEEIRNEINQMNMILFEIEKEKDVTWIVYISTDEYIQNIDVFFNMQNFERVWLNLNLSGKPKDYIEALYQDLNEKNNQIMSYEQDLENLVENCRHILLSSYRQLQTYHKINKIKKYIMHDSKHTFYLVAWVPESEIEKLADQLDTCQNIDYIIEEKTENKSPTKLKNHRLIKPFETLVKMYGVPNNNELDPTLFVAITAFLMFGFMFGDVGHGLVFFIAGFFLRRKNKDFGDILMARRDFICHFWGFIWKCFWKRRYPKSENDPSNGKY